jgi:hypothetical protein
LSAIPAVGEQAAQHAAGRRPEHRQWIGLGRDDGELDADDADDA